MVLTTPPTYLTLTIRILIFAVNSILHLNMVVTARRAGNVLPPYIKDTQFAHIVDEQVAEPHRFFGLSEGVLVTVNLAQDGAELHLNFGEDG